MNNLEDLKNTLLAVHARDTRQTLRAFVWAEIFICLFLFVIIYSLLSTGAQLPPVLYGIFALMVIGAGVPFAVKYWQSRRRPARIAELIAQLQQGEQVTNIYAYTGYKLMLPIRLIRIRLFPMEYAQIVVGSTRRKYDLPFTDRHLQSFRALISGPVADIVHPSANWSSN